MSAVAPGWKLRVLLVDDAVVVVEGVEVHRQVHDAAVEEPRADQPPQFPTVEDGGPLLQEQVHGLGVALQLTNILRDVAEDWRNGRVYLPQDELAAFGVSEADIDAGQVTDHWRDFMRFQIARNRQLYEEAWPGIAMLNGDGRFAIAAAAELYRAILTDIEQHDYDVFTRRASIGLTGKLSRLPGIWWRSQRTTAPLQTQTV